MVVRFQVVGGMAVVVDLEVVPGVLMVVAGAAVVVRMGVLVEVRVCMDVAVFVAVHPVVVAMLVAMHMAVFVLVMVAMFGGLRHDGPSPSLAAVRAACGRLPLSG